MKKSPERKALEKLVESVEIHLYLLDQEMKKPSSFERGRRVGFLCSTLNTTIDGIRYHTLGVNFRRDKPLEQRVLSRLEKQRKKEQKGKEH